MTQPADYNAKGLAAEIKFVGQLQMECKRLEEELKAKQTEFQKAQERLFLLGLQILAS